jgi:hypothetical protein
MGDRSPAYGDGMVRAATGRRRAVLAALVIEAVLASFAVAAGVARRESFGPDYVRIAEVPAEPAEPSVGSYAWDCGRNENGHRSTANIVVTPDGAGSAHHVHDYLGNLSVEVGTTVADLASGDTTCANSDKSSYYWPVLRTGEGRGRGHGGRVLVPESVSLTFFGNPRSPVVAMPPLLRGAVGDAFARTNGGARAAAVWSCSATPERRSFRYPICPRGQRVLRIFDFPSCWDGRRADSEDHRRHLVFPAPGGGCPISTFAVPRLRVVVAYEAAAAARFRIDSFPEQRHSPRTDHAFFVNLMPEALMAGVVRCLNAGRRCQ